MTTFKAKDQWHDLDDDGHRFRLLVAGGQIVGGVLKHYVKGLDAVECEPGLVQWEPYGTIRPLFTLTSNPGEKLSLSPFVVCSVCGDAGYIEKGEWIATDEEDDGVFITPLEDESDDDQDGVEFRPAIRREMGDKVPEEEEGADRRLYDMRGGATVVVPVDEEGEFEADLLTCDSDSDKNILQDSGAFSLRKSLIDEALTLITGDRNVQYGPPHKDFQRTADMVTAMWQDKLAPGQVIEAHDVAEFIMCVKLSRLQWTPEKRDNWTDIVGYAACGYEAFRLTHPNVEEK